MFKYLYGFFFCFFFFTSCDKVNKPFEGYSSDLDQTLYPGVWSQYVANEWPDFSQTPNTNVYRNVLIEEFTGHQCSYCPLASVEAHDLYSSNYGRVFIAAIHAGADPSGMTNLQEVNPPDYPTNFTNQQGLQMGAFFYNNTFDISNPRGTINRKEEGGLMFHTATTWSSITSSILNTNDLKVNIQGKINYYPTTKGAFLHVEVEKLDPNLSDLAIVSYLIEDSIVGDQKMPDNTHNSSYVHRDIHRGNLSSTPFGINLTADLMSNDNYYVNYSFEVPNQLDGNHNPSNMHVLVYVYDTTTLEIYQVIKVPIQ
ncbi:MAG: Omp28-related outer membrane protein [Crocinitomicaceae bacterium]|nr:Omp28-related outer membrane protein [Crocinitomicaceae bacterium]